MNCGRRTADTDTCRRDAWRGIGARLALVAIATCASGAFAATFYKWTDAQGQVHYGDTPPKGFTGEVTRVEVDPGEHVATPPGGYSKEQRATLGVPAAPAGPDILEQRRATRAALEARLDAARAKLDAAKAALADATGQGSGQVIQQTFDPGRQPTGTPLPSNANGTVPTQPSMGGGLGMSANRSNCRVNANKTVTCAALVPSEEYQQHVASLEDAVKRAEQEVSDAEIAYRKGVD